MRSSCATRLPIKSHLLGGNIRLRHLILATPRGSSRRLELGAWQPKRSPDKKAGRADDSDAIVPVLDTDEVDYDEDIFVAGFLKAAANAQPRKLKGFGAPRAKNATISDHQRSAGQAKAPQSFQIFHL